MRRAVKILLSVAVLAGILMLFLFPGRTFLQEEHSISSARHRLELLQNENSKLQTQASSLQNPAIIAQIAHRDYGLVKPGQKAYEIIPPQAGPTTTTTTAGGAGGNGGSGR